MPILKRRSKVMSFRLSEQEHRDLLGLCNSLGSRSLSDLARHAMNGLLGAANRNGSGNANDNGSSVEVAVAELRGRMDEVDRELSRITRFIEEQQQKAL